MLPKWFREKHKDAYENMKLNGYSRLISNFDIYKTLKAVLENDYSSGVAKVSKNNPGVSLFQEIPESRDCDSAGIPAHWCICGKSQEIPTDDPRAIRAGEILIKTINNILNQDKRDLCIQYKDFTVKEAKLKLPSNDIAITLRTKPIVANFRSTIRLQDDELFITNIERLDTYARFVKCLEGGTQDQRELVPLTCVCKDSVNLP